MKSKLKNSERAYLPTPLPGIKASTEESNAKALIERITDIIAITQLKLVKISIFCHVLMLLGQCVNRKRQKKKLDANLLVVN